MRDMFLSRAGRVIARKFKACGIVRKVLEWEFDRYFATIPIRSFRGIYDSFDDAARSAPATGSIGFDQPESVAMYFRSFRWIFPSDYPTMLWLSRAMKEGARVFDYGGNVGISFHSFKKYMDYPANLEWTACDLPAVTRAGEELAVKEGSAGLTFTNSFEKADGADILLASGSLQYIESPLAESLAKLDARPRHLIINRVPLYDGKPFVTLQSIATAFCPYHVFNATDFVRSISDLGYELIDRWENPDVPCEIPFHPEKSIRALSGLYFKRSVSGSATR